MEIHPPHAIRSVKDFLLQLLTITVGILIALSLDGLLEWQHHKHLIHEAEANLTAEIRENQQENAKTMQALHANLEQLKDMLSLVHKLQENRTTPLKNINFSWTLEDLHATSWNTASATGAIAYMDYAEVKRYTRIYDLQQHFITIQNRAFDSIVEVYGLSTLLQRNMRRVSDVELSQAERILGLALANAGAVESMENALDEEYMKILRQ